VEDGIIEDDMASAYPDAKRKLLEKYLQGKLSVRTEAIPRRKPGENIPLSHAQEQVWVHAQLAPHLPLYNEPVTIHYSGCLNPEALERSFNEILRRHEAWRTCFNVVDGQPVQEVHDELSISIPVIDLTGVPSPQREATALQIATVDAREPLDLGRVPLFRARLIRLDEREYRLYLTLCHIIFDGVALYRVFLPELAALYKAYAAGAPSPLPKPPIQYPDYACWERRTHTNEILSKEIGYWREQLRGPLPEAYLPGDHRLPRLRTFRGSMYPFKLRSPLMRPVRDFCRKEGVSVFHVMFAAFSALLHRYSGEPRIPVGMVTAGRNRPETESLLGYFLNTVVVPADVSGNPSFRTLAHRARKWTLDAMDHDQMPFEHLVQALRVPREPSRNPLFQALFSLEPPLPEIDPNWRLTQMDVDTGATKYDLYLELDDRGDEILARFHYSTDLFDRPTMARMAMHWKSLLRNGIAHPDQSLSDLSLLTSRERRNVQRNWQGRTCDYPQACVHQLFQEQADRTPDAIAVESQGHTITYRQLNERANGLATFLLQRGLQPDSLVGLCVERCLPMVVGLLGLLKAGAAYVPLDPRLPDERLSYLMADSKPVAVVTDERSRRREFGADAIVLDTLPDLAGFDGESNPQTKVDVANLAYVMYTSGSTGTPKGVAVEHRSLVNLLTSMQREPGLSADDVLLAVTTLSFDIAGLEIFLPLITGARLVLADSTDVIDGARLMQLLHDSGANLMQATPTTWRLLIEAGWQGSPNLRILCGGESLTPELAGDLVRRGAVLWNVYGPTETTIWSSIYRVTGCEEDTIPVGRPIANTAMYVLDQNGNPVPANVTGEIYIAGDGLARGYLNRPQLTEERFVSNLLTPGQFPRLYRTGDLGRWRSGGDIECLGRADTQIKLRGMRIELGEVESVLASHPAVQQAVVIVKGEAEQRKLSTFVVVKDRNAVPTAPELRRHVRTLLPESMAPAEYCQVDSLPRLPSGKVDRAALASTRAILLRDEQTWIGPRNEIEVQLAAIWTELLKVEKLGVDQNFFELGGHSLLVLQMTARIRRCWGLDVQARTVFEAPTIAALAQKVETARAQGLIARTPGLHRQYDQRPTNQDAILSQLHRLPAEEAQSLLKAMLEEKEIESRRQSGPE
jgi:amino acid adenylation domain-containing protein